MVCGGCPRDLHLGLKPRDIDIFVNYCDANTWYKLFRLLGFKQKRHEFYYNKLILDVIPTEKRTSTSIIRNFDCDVCKWYIKDGKPTPLNQAIKYKTNRRIATFIKKKDLFGTCNIRSEKFTKRGWTCIINE